MSDAAPKVPAPEVAVVVEVDAHDLPLPLASAPPLLDAPAFEDVDDAPVPPVVAPVDDPPLVPVLACVSDAFAHFCAALYSNLRSP